MGFPSGTAEIYNGVSVRQKEHTVAKSGQLVIRTPLGRYGVLLLIGVALLAACWRLLAENTTWTYFVLAVVALVPLSLFLSNRRVVHLIGLFVIGLLMFGVSMADRLQETNREQVLRRTHELLRAVERADHPAFDRNLAGNFQWHGMNRIAMLKRVRESLRPDEVRSCGISAARVRGVNGSTTLVVEGNLSASGQYGSLEGTFLGLIELNFTRQPDGQYLVSGARVTWPNGTEVTLPR